MSAMKSDVDFDRQGENGVPTNGLATEKAVTVVLVKVRRQTAATAAVEGSRNVMMTCGVGDGTVGLERSRNRETSCVVE